MIQLILSLLIQAGYADDPRVNEGLKWLLAMRQEDGGWTINEVLGKSGELPHFQKTVLE